MNQIDAGLAGANVNLSKMTAKKDSVERITGVRCHSAVLPP